MLRTFWLRSRRRIWLVWIGNIPGRMFRWRRRWIRCRMWRCQRTVRRRNRSWIRPRSATILERLLPRTVALTTPLPAVRFGGLHDLSGRSVGFDVGLGVGRVKAAPTRLPFTMRARFFFGSVTLRASRAGIRFGKLNNFSINADPAKFPAMRECFFSGAITLIASHSGLGFWDLDDSSVNAAPPGLRRSQRRAGRIGCVNWIRSALRTSATNWRLRRRRIRIASVCYRQNQIQTR